MVPHTVDGNESRADVPAGKKFSDLKPEISKTDWFFRIII